MFLIKNFVLFVRFVVKSTIGFRNFDLD